MARRSPQGAYDYRGGPRKVGVSGCGVAPAGSRRPGAARYVRRNKTERADTAALLEANRNEEIQPVPIKSVEQQGIASLHRVRSTWLATRTARINTIRGLLRHRSRLSCMGRSLR
jgi:transposase